MEFDKRWAEGREYNYDIEFNINISEKLYKCQIFQESIVILAKLLVSSQAALNPISKT